jgi:hypothetical protein
MYQAKSIVYNAVFVCMVLTVASVAYAIEDPPVFDRQWSTPFPWGVAQDTLGNIYVVDGYSMQIRKFNKNGSFLDEWTSCGAEDSSACPTAWDIATDSSNNVYVADAAGVTKFDQDGNLLLQFGNSSSPFIPIGIATHSDIDSDGSVITYVYVTNSVDNTVQKLTSEGAPVTEWGGTGSDRGQFRSPFDVAVDGKGNVYVADTLNLRIQKFDGDGIPLAAWPTGTVYSLATDSSDNVYAIFPQTSTIMKFTPEGDLLTEWGKPGTEEGAFDYPVRVNTGPLGEILVSDTGNSRIQIFKSALEDADGDDIADSEDNCVDVFNPSQEDTDEDNIGNVCDTCPDDPSNDLDKDGVCGNEDNCPEYPNKDQADMDNDGIGDVCDECNSKGITGSILPSKAILWPPDNRMIPVTIDVSNIVSSSPFAIMQIDSVNVIEMDKKGRDIYEENILEPDYQITDALSVNLRSKRAGNSQGRSYIINVTVEDCSGPHKLSATVVVPHDKRK